MTDLQPIPFQLNVSTKYGLSADNVVFDKREKTRQYQELAKHISFPSTRAVLWNRVPIGSTSVVSLLGKPGELQLVINERSLQLAFKQIQLHGADFNGFFMGQLDQQDGLVFIRIDRFDPGRDGHIQTENGSQMLRLPTTVIPGDMPIPVCLHNGMAFVDHNTSESHTKEEFMKTMQVMESWCSRKDKLNVINFLSARMKCCFQPNGTDVFAYITCGCVCISSKFNMVPINAIPVIPTALARNLISPNALSEIYHEIKTGFVTMDQTRKLLLLLETDPKALELPLVGVWLSGVEQVNSVEVWASCIRFCHSKHIDERVYAPPSNFLLILYSQKTANPMFYEFSMIESHKDMSFQLLTCCEGIQLKQGSSDGTTEEYAFDLTSKSSGLLANNFTEAQIALNRQLAEEQPENYFKNDDMHADECSPQATPSPLPHPQGLKIAPAQHSVPDLSLCESFVIENGKDDSNSNLDNQSEENPESIHVKNVIPKKFPRQTKASIARINMNKPNNSSAKKKKLAINFNQNTPKGKKSKKTSKELYREENVEIGPVVDIGKSEEKSEDEPRVPVQLRLQPSLQLQSSFAPNIADSIFIEDDEKGMVSNNEHSYHPENYSDVIDNQSFLIDSFADPPVSHTISGDEVSPSNVVHVDDKNFSPQSHRNSLDSSKMQIEEHASGNSIKISDKNETLPRPHGRALLPDSTESTPAFPSTPPQNEQTDLYNLVVSQQKQLTELQQQLQVFMNHQKDNEKLKNSENKAENVLMKEIDDQNQNILNMQVKQQEQLDDLQRKLQVFLQHTMKEEVEKRHNTADESTSQQPLSKVSIGVSTGSSLLWPSENLASTHSDTSLRGISQASGMDASRPKKTCRCCRHCQRHQKSPNKQKLSDSITNNASSQSSNLSEINTGDIAGSIFNDTASSTKTSLKAADLPMFNDSQQESPDRVKQALDWNASPMLGESASMLMKQDKEKEKVDPLQENPIMNTKTFYEQMMVQVQEMITAQDISDASNTAIPVKNTNPPSIKEVALAIVNTPSKTVSLTEEEKVEKVRAATIKQLQEIVRDPELSPTKDVSEYKQSVSMAVIPSHPHINYVSMTTDETFHENVQLVDHIAAKYLPTTEYPSMQKKEVRNKMVKFEGVYEWQIPGHIGNYTSVNFSCNMSIASKKYLQKYALVDQDNGSLPLKVLNGERHGPVNVKEKRRDRYCEGKENILDISKLKNLPKLV